MLESTQYQLLNRATIIISDTSKRTIKYINNSPSFSRDTYLSTHFFFILVKIQAMNKIESFFRETLKFNLAYLFPH